MKTNDPIIKAIAKQAFPEYKGRKYSVKYCKSINTSFESNWSGGSRTVYRFVRLDNGSVMNNPNQDLAPWRRDYSSDGNENAVLLPGLACVTHTFFCGKDLGLTVNLCEGSMISNAEKSSIIGSNNDYKNIHSPIIENKKEY
jgi:hypothetical protein